MDIIRRHVVVAVAIVIAGCSNAGSGPIDDFFSADASVRGRVIDIADRPLPGVDVALTVPREASPFSYQTEHSTTDSTGYFRVALHRIASPGSIPNPDTLTARVVVTASGPQYRELLPGGGFSTDSSTVVWLQFVPHNVVGPVTSLTIRWKIP
jgi:hypothetical protein